VSDELLAVSNGLGTGWEPLQEVMLARRVNAALGGALVGPWDIPDMDQATLEVLLAYVDDLPSMRMGRQKVEAFMANWRASHPTYRKHMRQ